MPKKKRENKNLQLAVLFGLVIIFFIILSLVIKLFLLFRESKFDGQHAINIQAISKQEVDFISFSPSTKTISILKLDPKDRFLEVPIDGKILYDNNLSKQNLSRLFLKSAVSGRVEELTIIDVLRLIFFSRSLKSGSVYERSLQKDTSEVLKQDIINQTFKDDDLSLEKKSIEIINATDTFGLGSRLANLISNIGGDVILVNSQPAEKKSKIIFYKNSSYTVERLSKYLGIPSVRTDERRLADITVIIGEDILDKLKF